MSIAHSFSRLRAHRNRPKKRGSRPQAPSYQPRLERLEERTLLSAGLAAAPVYFHVHIFTAAGIYSPEGGAPIASDFDHASINAGSTFRPVGAVSVLSSISSGDAEAFAQASASIDFASMSGTASGGGTAVLNADGSFGVQGFGTASVQGTVLIGAELGSAYHISLDGSDDFSSTLQGTLNPGSYTREHPGAVLDGVGWWIVEDPGLESPPKLAYSLRGGGGVTVSNHPLPGKVFTSFSVSATAEHTPPPPGDIVAISRERSCEDGSCFSFTYRVDENPVPPFRVALYASKDAQFDLGEDDWLSTVDTPGELQLGMIANWVAAPWLRTVGEHTVRVNLPGPIDPLLPEDAPFLLMVADDLGLVAETNEENNAVFLSCPVTDDLSHVPGEPFNPEQLTPQLQEAFKTFKVLVQAEFDELKVPLKDRVFLPTSGLRSRALQEHLYELRTTFGDLLDAVPGMEADVVNKRPQLKPPSTEVALACGPLIEKVNEEIRGHELVPNPDDRNAPNVGKFSRHEAGPDGKAHAMDISVSTSLTEARINKLADDAGLVRPCPKDRPHYQLKGSICKVNTSATAKSPVNLLVEDPQGRKVGFDPLTGVAVNEIGEWAEYSGPGSEPQVIVIYFSEVLEGAYHITGVGTGAGPYSITVDAWGEDPATVLYEYAISSGVAVLGQPIESIVPFDFLTAPAQIDEHELYVTAVYQNVLRRPPDEGGLAYWSDQLDRGVPRSTIAALLVHSDEYYANRIIVPAYDQFLGRGPDAVGLAYWVDQMQRHGVTDERLEAGFIGSPEFFARAGGTDRLWVRALFRDLLGRPADTTGEEYWVEQLRAGALRAAVAYGFAASLERERQRVSADYFDYLGRVPDQEGIDYWVTQFSLGLTNEDIITGFVASDEYFARHT